MKPKEENPKVGYVYDELMTKHYNVVDLTHPEGPERITTPYKYLKEKGFIEKCHFVKSRLANEKELELVHSKEYIAEVKGYKSKDMLNPCKLPEKWPTYVSDGVYDAASCAVGSVLNLVDAVYTEEISNGFAIVRPPGHHAEVSESCGFCFFNTTSIAAKYAQEKYGIKKVLIVDWDIHHGNGIQHIFYSDPSVMYVSLHRYDNGEYFPNLKESNAESVGIKDGLGFNVNIPWNKDQMSDPDYKAAFHDIVIPIAKQFEPNLILIASGFDAAAADPVGEYILTPKMYGYMTQTLLSVAKAPLLVITEGGYNPTANGEALAEIVQVLLGSSEIKMDAMAPCKRAEQTIQHVIKVQSEYWTL